MTNLIGIDVGGTFTDFVFLDETGSLKIEKVPSSETAAFKAVSEGFERIGVKHNEASRISYGTTIATNTLLERSGAKTGLITTKGFRDVIEMQRWHRKELYDIHQRRQAPLVRRARRVTVPERVAADGTVLMLVEIEALVQAIENLLSIGTESVAICLINSYINPVNEQKIKEIVNDKYPSLPISVSSEISPIIGEYERSIVTVINAYIKPKVQDHLEALFQELERYGLKGNFEIVQSNGGLISKRDAIMQPVRMILSGPAGGVTGASFIGHHVGVLNLITLDMGGTSCDVSLIRQGRPEVSKEEEIEWNVPISLPMLTVKTIGAGGGSIVWIDRGNVMKVGPSSAGSHPGPACYNQGGQKPTITDAQLLLGRLTESGLLGGRLPLDKKLASDAFETVSVPLGLDLIKTAAGAIRIADQRMIEAIRLVTVDRGYDPRDFVLLAFGGAGPLHACEMARELGIARLLIPPSPGVLSALGLAVADVKTSQIASVNQSFSSLNEKLILDGLSRLEKAANLVLEAHEVPSNQRNFTYTADIRYEKQSFEVQVISEGLRNGNLEEVAKDFHRTHNDLYHYSMPEQTPFLVNLEVTGTGVRPKLNLKAELAYKKSIIPTGTRKVYFNESDDFIDAAVFDRTILTPGNMFDGPAIVDQFDTTTVVPPGFSVQIDEYQNMIIELRE